MVDFKAPNIYSELAKLRLISLHYQSCRYTPTDLIATIQGTELGIAATFSDSKSGVTYFRLQ